MGPKNKAKGKPTNAAVPPPLPSASDIARPDTPTSGGTSPLVAQLEGVLEQFNAFSGIVAEATEGDPALGSLGTKIESLKEKIDATSTKMKDWFRIDNKLPDDIREEIVQSMLDITEEIEESAVRLVDWRRETLRELNSASKDVPLLSVPNKSGEDPSPGLRPLDSVYALIKLGSKQLDEWLKFYALEFTWGEQADDDKVRAIKAIAEEIGAVPP